jgi:hypothetical protein
VPFLDKKCKIYPENPTIFGGIIGFLGWKSYTFWRNLERVLEKKNDDLIKINAPLEGKITRVSGLFKPSITKLLTKKESYSVDICPFSMQLKKGFYRLSSPLKLKKNYAVFRLN